MNPKAFSAFVLLLSWPPWPTWSVKTWKHDLSEGDETWETERRKKRTKKKGGCATSNSQYLRVKCALQFFPLAGPWECNALAFCLAKCVPYVWALYPSVLSSPERGATGQGARERCLWLKTFFFVHLHIWSGETKKEKAREAETGWGETAKPWLCGWTWMWEVQKSPPPPPSTHLHHHYY